MKRKPVNEDWPIIPLPRRNVARSLDRTFEQLSRTYNRFSTTPERTQSPRPWRRPPPKGGYRH